REHYQWNMDIWGVSGVEAEAELISAIVASFQAMGVTEQDVGIKINSRKILNALMASFSIPEDKWVAACVLVDKLDKVPLSALSDDLSALGITEAVAQQLVDALQIKTIDEFALRLGADSPGVADILRLQELLEGYGVGQWVQFDASVVRGLAYYTGVVFEGFDRQGELRAICGGGRYDSLLQSLGGEVTPAVGFGFGDAVIYELLKAKGLLPQLEGGSVDVLVYPMEESLRPQAIKTATTLRKAGHRVDIVLDSRKPKWVFNRADKIHCRVVVMLAGDEHERGEALVRDMRGGEQQALGYEGLAEGVREILAVGAVGEMGAMGVEP
ncbi:hypothetical protein B484DRAFT_325004, partial [Ochromonadaceae sp. CCMP2298]